MTELGKLFDLVGIIFVNRISGSLLRRFLLRHITIVSGVVDLFTLLVRLGHRLLLSHCRFNDPSRLMGSSRHVRPAVKPIRRTMLRLIALELRRCRVIGYQSTGS
jgi:hypothetical protein